MTTDFVIDIIIILLVTFFFVFTLTFFELYIAVILFLLMGVWLLDVLIKRSLNFDNITLFADLSFSALVFAIGQGVSLIDLTSEEIMINPTFVTELILIIFILVFFWIMNLRMCNYIIVLGCV